jgi:hypothetical protein
MEAGLLTCAVPYESISETCASMVNISRTDLHEHLQAVLSKYDKLDITDAHTRCAAAFPVICELARRCYAIKAYIKPGKMYPLISCSVFKLGNGGLESRILALSMLPENVCGIHDEMETYVLEALRGSMSHFSSLLDYAADSAIHNYFE